MLLEPRNLNLTWSGPRTPRYAYFEYGQIGEEELYALKIDPY